ncbi:hypothetical protein ACFL6Z_06795, partial [Pseudomonadota bacterium]
MIIKIIVVVLLVWLGIYLYRRTQTVAKQELEQKEPTQADPQPEAEITDIASAPSEIESAPQDNTELETESIAQELEPSPVQDEDTVVTAVDEVEA